MAGKEIGYRRVSSILQSTQRQLYGITLDKVFEDKISGKDTNRPQLQACLDYIRDGDVLHIHSIDRLARNLFDLLDLVKTILAKGATIHFHKEAMTFTPDTENPTQTLYLNILGSIAQFERSLIRERQKEGIAIARMKNSYKNVGRKPKLSPEQITEIKSKRTEGIPIAQLSKEYAVSRQSIYTAISK